MGIRNSISRINIVLMGLSIVVVIAYIVFEAGYIFSEHSNMLSKSLFAIINLAASFFLAYQASIVSVTQQNRKIAKMSIRHVREYIDSINRLIDLVEIKLNQASSKPAKQNLNEIKNHLFTVKGGIANSILDFRDIVNEEYVEETQQVGEIRSELDVILELEENLKQLQRDDLQKNKEKIESIQHELKLLKQNVREKISKLPIGFPNMISEQGIFISGSPTDTDIEILSEIYPDAPVKGSLER